MMVEKSQVIEKIKQAFLGNEYPGDLFLQGSHEGSEPAEEVGPFIGKQHWDEIGADILDQHSAALSFFSEAGFGFFLPAFLLAPLNAHLLPAHPPFHPTPGFSDEPIEHELQGRKYVIRMGKSVL